MNSAESKKELRYVKIQQALKQNLKKRKLFQKKINRKIKKK
mgnify:CR=1 FL=1